jgi:hypothetical protein
MLDDTSRMNIIDDKTKDLYVELKSTYYHDKKPKDYNIQDKQAKRD